MIDPKVKEAWRRASRHVCSLIDKSECTLTLLRDAYLRAEAMRRKADWHAGIPTYPTIWETKNGRPKIWDFENWSDADWEAEVRRELENEKTE